MPLRFQELFSRLHGVSFPLENALPAERLLNTLKR